MERTLKDLIEEREALHKKMIDLGVPEGHVDGIMVLMADYQDLRKDLSVLRSTQFTDDAFNLSTETKSNNKVPSIAAFLRLFAEHIARATILATNVQVERIDELVDGIAPMSNGQGTPYYDASKKLILVDPFTPPDINYTIHDGCDHDGSYGGCVLDDPESMESQEVALANDHSYALQNLLNLEKQVKQQRQAAEMARDKAKSERESEIS